MTSPSALSAIILASAFMACALAGCSQQKDAGDSQTATRPAAPDSAPDEDHQQCFACDGRGTTAVCFAAGCKSGDVECPGPCLKLTRGKWEHMQVAGHDPNDLWQKFPDGPGRTVAWSQGHVGEV